MQSLHDCAPSANIVLHRDGRVCRMTRFLVPVVRGLRALELEAVERCTSSSPSTQYVISSGCVVVRGTSALTTQTPKHSPRVRRVRAVVLQRVAIDACAGESQSSEVRHRAQGADRSTQSAPRRSDAPAASARIAKQYAVLVVTCVYVALRRMPMRVGGSNMQRKMSNLASVTGL